MNTRSPLVLDAQDSVGVAIDPINAGDMLDAGVCARDYIPSGHKIALQHHNVGQHVLRYGQVIGAASQVIAPGDHVHEHNLAMASVRQDYAFGSKVTPAPPVSRSRTFQGLRRPDGGVATRNYIGILTSVNCAAHVANEIARAFTRHRPSGYDPMAEFPNVDGVVALTHTTGCGMGRGEPLEVLRRTISGYADHPNFSHILLLGLGCEVNQTGDMASIAAGSDRVRILNIQASGGTATTIVEGIKIVRDWLPDSNSATREPVPVSELSVALICGGSDGYSGITANPALGAASDLMVAHGGTVILSETPETYGAEHLLTRRAVSAEVGQKLVDRITWWEAYGSTQGASLNANPSPGNKRGGLTTILEKSLGALAKGGTSNLVDVVEYAERTDQRGLIFMDAPGYDPVQVTGQIAGGANLVAFTTGRGSVFGSVPAPTLKIASNSKLFERMADDMDFDCGGILTGSATASQCGEQIFERLIELASGHASKSEALGVGSAEFAPWVVGPTI